VKLKKKHPIYCTSKSQTPQVFLDILKKVFVLKIEIWTS
jgi:hypothetical protein